MLETDEMSNGRGAAGMTVEFKMHMSKAGRRKKLKRGEAPSEPPPAPTGRTHRVARLLALALHLQKLLDEGIVRDYADIARLSGLTRARVTQIMNLTLLAPRIQEEILFMPKVYHGHDPITERDIRGIALKVRWEKQVQEWRRF